MKAKTRAKTKLQSNRSAGTKPRPARSRGPKTKPALDTHGMMDLSPDLIDMGNAKSIAQSIKRAAESSDRLESTPFHSGMSVLNSLISDLELKKARLEAAKKELRRLYGEDDERQQAGESHPPQEFARNRNRSKGGRPRNDKPADNRPRSRPNKVV